MTRPLARGLRIASPLALIAAALALGLRSAGCQSAHPWHPREASPARCADCHQAVAAEWRDSGHAQAWTSPSFREATQDYTAQDCLGCHAPSSVVDRDGPPALREWRREDGVDCQACHLDESGRLVGPLEPDRDALLQAHMVRRDALLYRSNELCGHCHEQALAQVRAFSLRPERSGLVSTCQQCHMPVVVRGMTQGGDATTRVGEAVSGQRRQRRHTFELSLEGREREERLELSLEAGRDAAGVRARATLYNGLPHHVPVGNPFSSSRVVLRLTGYDAQGEPTASEEYPFATANPLPSADSHTLESTLPAETTRVVLELWRTHDTRPSTRLHAPVELAL